MTCIKQSGKKEATQTPALAESETAGNPIFTSVNLWNIQMLTYIKAAHSTYNDCMAIVIELYLDSGVNRVILLRAVFGPGLSRSPLHAALLLQG